MLIIGLVFVDVKGFSLGHYLPEGTNIGDVQVTPGGVCRNVAEDMARLGLRTRFVSMVDDTAMGRDVRDALAVQGVDVSRVILTPRGMGLWLAILDENGELRGSVSRQPDLAPFMAYVAAQGEAMMAECRSVILSFDTNADITAELLRLAEKHQRPVYGLVGNMSVILEHPEYLKKSACFICNENEAGRLFGEPLDDAEPLDVLALLKHRSREAGINAMVVTMGPRGSVFVDHAAGEAGWWPALEVTVEDTTGAGDAFFTGTVIALERGLPLSRAVRAGAELAARTLRVAGASCPASDDFLDFVEALRVSE